MRFILLLTILSGLFFSSCKDKNKGTTITSEDGKSAVTIDTKNMAAASDQMQQRVEELKKLPPLTLDQIKANLPEELMGLKRSNFSANSSMGFSVGEAEYKKDDSTYYQLSVYDVAGEAGSGIYALQFWGAMNMQSETEDGYTKTTDFNGAKAVEKFEKNNNTYDLMYLANDRLMVNIKGVNTGFDNVKQAASSLHFTTK